MMKTDIYFFGIGCVAHDFHPTFESCLFELKQTKTFTDGAY